MDNKGGYLKQGWLVLLLSLLFGGLLAGVHVAWNGKIEQNKINLAKDQIPTLMGLDERTPVDAQPQKLVATGPGGLAKTYNAYAVFYEGKLIGWAVPSGGQGFADRIEVLIGLDPSGEMITGLTVLSQKETPGLGDNITKEKWIKQWAGKKALTPLDVKKGGQELAASDILAVTGATVSSRAVTDIVNETVKNVRPLLMKKAAELVSAPAATTAPSTQEAQ